MSLLTAELASGELKSYFGDEIYFKIVYTTTSYDATFNTSEVHIALYVGRDSLQYTLPSRSTVFFNMDIEGIDWEEQVSTDLPIDGDEIVREVLVKSFDYTIQHDNDGTKKVRMCGGIKSFKEYHREELNYESDYKSVCRTVKLTDIPQCSAIGAFQNRDIYIGASGINVAQGRIFISISPLETTCRHDVIITLGEYSSTIYDVYDRVEYSPPAEWLNAMPTQTLLKGVITLITYDASGTEIGRGSTWWNARASEINAAPQYDSVATEHIGCTWNYSLIYLQGLSKVKLTVNNARALYGASIVKYVLYCNDEDYSGEENSFTFGVLTDTGQADVGGYIQDSRGIKTSLTIPVKPTVYEYTPPRFLDVTAERCGTSGTLINDGEYLRALVSYEISAVAYIQNTATTKIEYKKTTDSNYTQLSTTFSNGVAHVTSQTFDINSAYNLRFSVTDRFSTSYYETILPKSFITMEFLKGGRGVSFGKECTIPDAMDIGFKLYARRGIWKLAVCENGVWNTNADLSDHSLFAVHLNASDFDGLDTWILCFKGVDGSNNVSINGSKTSIAAINTEDGVDSAMAQTTFVVRVNPITKEYAVYKRNTARTSQVIVGSPPSYTVTEISGYNGNGKKYTTEDGVIDTMYAIL